MNKRSNAKCCKALHYSSMPRFAPLRPRSLLVRGLLGALSLCLFGLVALWLGLRYSALPEHLSHLQTLRFEEIQRNCAATGQLILDRHGQVLSVANQVPAYEKSIAGTHIKPLKPSKLPSTQLPWLPLADFGSALPQALVAAEDRRFWQHDGVDGRAMLAAVVAQIQGKARGGSTLSMQLARQLASREAMPRSWRGKLMQMRVAWALERQLSKAQILEAYLNLVPLRGDVRGLHTGAALFLGVASPSTLSAAQQTWLLAMIPAPQAAPDKLQARACRMLQRVSSAACQASLPDAQDAFAQAKARRVQHALPPLLRTGRSSLEARTQRITYHALMHMLSDLQAQGATDASAVVLDNATGEMRAYASLSQLTLAGKTQTLAIQDFAQTPRQSGSILKPLLYAQALSVGVLRDSSLLPASTRSFAPYKAGEPRYWPRYNGHDAAHQVSPREALGGSHNIPAVHVLSKLGVKTFAAKLHALGLMPLEVAERAGLSLALGSAETQLLPLTQAYRCLSQQGLCVAGSASPSTMQAQFTAPASQLVTRYLSDPAPRNRAFGDSNPLNTAFASAVKTGTSNDARDSWAVGYTPEHTVGVWLGRRDRRPMQDIYGPGGAGRAWRQIMEELALGKPR
jgi:penicillin-binding protein 1C